MIKEAQKQHFLEKKNDQRIDFFFFVFVLAGISLPRIMSYGLPNSRHLCARVAADSALGKELQRLLQIPLDNYDDLTVLQLEHFTPCLQLLDYAARRDVAMHLIERIIEADIRVQEAVQVGTLTDTGGTEAQAPTGDLTTIKGCFSNNTL